MENFQYYVARQLESVTFVINGYKMKSTLIEWITAQTVVGEKLRVFNKTVDFNTTQAFSSCIVGMERRDGSVVSRHAASARGQRLFPWPTDARVLRSKF